ncbi:MAG: preprotein translocase subunit YajC [Alphaproteobacteria bacterium]|nr:preprotein translocase subunit YajC [Alphaproteobacteria bacterium]
MFISKALAQEAATETAPDAITATAATAPAAGEAFMMNMLLVVVLVVMFYFLMIRPQQKRLKEHNNMLGALQKGDRVVTQGGLIGKIEAMNDNEMQLDVGNGSITVLRNSVIGKYEPKTDSAKK